jgi:phage terminase Nu1 subunit (DNA packaging protein)
VSAPLKPFRWSLNRAADELGVARPKVRSRLARAGITAAADKTYTTKQILSALFGDKDAEELRKLTAEADVAEMKRDEMDGSLLPADVVEAVWQNAISEMKDIVTSLDIPDEARRRILAALRTIPIGDYTEEKAGASDADSSEKSGVAA